MLLINAASIFSSHFPPKATAPVLSNTYKRSELVSLSSNSTLSLVSRRNDNLISEVQNRGWCNTSIAFGLRGNPSMKILQKEAFITERAASLNESVRSLYIMYQLMHSRVN